MPYCRCGAETRDDNVIECNIVKDDDYLHFKVSGYGTEASNLDEPDEDYEKRRDAEQEIAWRLKEGESYRTIQKETDANTKLIAKINKSLERY